MKPLASTTRSPRRTAAIGVVAATLTVGATGAAYALAQNGASPDTAVVAADRPVVSDEPVDPPMPPELANRTPTPVPGEEEYTQERSDAFWAAGYHMEDADALAELWQVSVLEAKGRAGQMLLDGQPVPVAPGSSLDLSDPETLARLDAIAYWDAGYTAEDGAALAALWSVDVFEAKATAGQMLRAGQALPIPPSGTPVS
ncbi:hypothetical protein OMK64_06075 [Cellulomonas fimi]|uniref:hypothetical protein n=1 Tax=Cellulomonas fimi TaxID=1708 RepID=UPI00234E36E6|nr:hypothetical protein [Cellulomonas fimi]MDC7121100.1 hypothetical protein [Cellulomonas fimi]